MSFSPSSTWEVLAELVLGTSPSSTDSACSSGENRRRFVAWFEENHAAPRDDFGWVGEGEVLQKRKGVSSANGGSGTERFHAHRFVVALRSDPMRAMLQSGECSTDGTSCGCRRDAACFAPCRCAFCDLRMDAYAKWPLQTF